MNDATAQHQAASAKPALARGRLRLFLLILLLGLLVGALAFDRKVARPLCKAMLEKLDTASEARAQSPRRQLTPAEVRQLLGRPPYRVEEGRHYVIERFGWRSGLPWRTYDINVVYHKTSSGPVFQTAFHLEEPDPHLLPGYQQGGSSKTPTAGDFNLTSPSGETRPYSDSSPEAPEGAATPPSDGASEPDQPTD